MEQCLLDDACSAHGLHTTIEPHSQQKQIKHLNRVVSLEAAIANAIGGAEYAENYKSDRMPLLRYAIKAHAENKTVLSRLTSFVTRGKENQTIESAMEKFMGSDGGLFLHRNAAYNGFKEMEQYMRLNHVKDINVEGELVAIQKDNPIPLDRSMNANPVLAALVAGHLDIVENLLDNGASFSVMNTKQFNHCLKIALSYGAESGDYHLLYRFIRDIVKQIATPDFNYMSDQNPKSSLRFLISDGIDGASTHGASTHSDNPNHLLTIIHRTGLFKQFPRAAQYLIKEVSKSIKEEIIMLPKEKEALENDQNISFFKKRKAIKRLTNRMEHIEPVFNESIRCIFNEIIIATDNDSNDSAELTGYLLSLRDTEDKPIINPVKNVEHIRDGKMDFSSPLLCVAYLNKTSIFMELIKNEQAKNSINKKPVRVGNANNFIYTPYSCAFRNSNNTMMDALASNGAYKFTGYINQTQMLELIQRSSHSEKEPEENSGCSDM